MNGGAAFFVQLDFHYAINIFLIIAILHSSYIFIQYTSIYIRGRAAPTPEHNLPVIRKFILQVFYGWNRKPGI